jgi:hypothetical protein
MNEHARSPRVIFALAADRLPALPEVRRFHISLRSRCTAMLAGLWTLIQARHWPD